MGLLGRIRRYLGRDIWKIPTADVRRSRRWAFKLLKLTLLSVQGFRKDRAGLRASALTLYTLLAIVPVLAVLFGIAKGFGLEGRLEAWILSVSPDQQDFLRRTVGFARQALENTDGGLVAGAGVILLLYSVVMITGNIERAMNHIWSVAKARSWGRRFSDYLSLILVGPFLVIGASSLNIYLETWASRATDAAPLVRLVGPMATLALQALPLVMLWLLFSFTYIFMPNIKVRIRSGLIGGAVTAVLYQTVQTLYIQAQVGVARNNAIYGSFAALPLFIVWLQISWHLVLFGAEVTNQHQHYQSNELEERMPNLSFRAIKRLSLAVAEEVIGRFVRGEPAPTAEAIGQALRLPSWMLGDLLRRLVEARVVIETSAVQGPDEAYLPARDPPLLTPAAILDALERLGEDVDARTQEAFAESSRVLAALDQCIRQSPVLTTASWMSKPPDS